MILDLEMITIAALFFSLVAGLISALAFRNSNLAMDMNQRKIRVVDSNPGHEKYPLANRGRGRPPGKHGPYKGRGKIAQKDHARTADKDPSMSQKDMDTNLAILEDGNQS